MRDYGFDGMLHFLKSFIRPELINSKLIVITTLVGSIIEVTTRVTQATFGFSIGLFAVLTVLLIFEFGTGIAASLKEYKETEDCKKKFNSKKFNGGGIKAMVWLLIIASFWRLYKDIDIDWLNSILHGVHGAVIVFVFCSYIVSISENMVRLGFVSFKWIIKFTKKKMKEIND